MAREATKPQRETTPEEWEHIREILANALELNPPERSPYLDTTCENNSMLRARLDELIAAHDATGAAGLELPAFSLTSSEPRIMADASSSQIGRRIGSYRIEAEIAHGGMGTVFRAVRADDEFKKKVAIKLVPGAGFSSHAAELFRRERQVLATLEHPNIARLLDGGTTEDGAPFLVMECVEGEPVTAYCESHRLTIEERVRLFRKICSAVQYAHQNLVIHRDIKPANILVTAEGEPKLLDFGIAKIIDLDTNANVTATAWQALTPAFASPEQISGEPISTASDVYSLGLVLYQVLTGQPAFSAVGLSSLQLQRMLLESDPELPSRVLYQKRGAREIFRQLQGDLDSIVAKAIRKNRMERYSSVEQFSDDLRRHLEHLPVLAQPDTLKYRAAKFAHRHKGGIVAAGLIVTSLIVGMSLTVYEARVARAERLRAESRFNDVRKLANSLLFDLHDAIQDLPGSTPARKLIAQKSLEYLDSLSAESGGDPGLLRELATAYERVGELQGHYLADNLGETSNSLASYGKALRIRQQLGEDHKAPWQDRLSLAESYRRMASQADAMNETRQALAELQKATEISEAIAQARPADSKILNELAFEYQVLATVQEQIWFEGWGELSAALETDKKGLAVATQVLRSDPNNLEAERRLGNDTLQIANAHSDLDDFSNAIESFNQALQIFRSVAAQSKAVKDRRRVAVVLNQLGQLYDRQGNWTLSLQNHEKGLEIYKQLVAEDPKNALLRQGLAIALVNTGGEKSKLRRLAEGRRDINQGIAIMRTLMNDPNEQQRHVLAEIYGMLADNSARSGQQHQAVIEDQAALQIVEAHSGPGDTGSQISIANCRLGIGQAQVLSGEHAAAAKELQQVLKLTASWVARGYRGELNRDALRDSGQAYAGLGDIEAIKARHSAGPEQQAHWKQAIVWYEQGLEIGRQIPPFAQLDVTDFRAAEVRQRLHQAESALRKLSSRAKVPIA